MDAAGAHARGAPALPRSAWSPSNPSVEAHLGTGSFRLQAERRRRRLVVVAAQSLADVDRIESDLVLLEAIAGPVLLVAVFFGTLLIGVKAASPVELARRRQLEFTADASHELRTPLSVIEAEVTLSLHGPRTWRRLPSHAREGREGERAAPRHCGGSALARTVRFRATAPRRRAGGRLGYRGRVC